MYDAAFSPDDRLLACASPVDRAIHVIDIEAAREVFRLPNVSNPEWCEFDPAGRWFAASSSSPPSCAIWDWRLPDKPRVDLPHPGHRNAFNSDGTRLATFGLGLHLWRTADWKMEPDLSLADNNVDFFAAFSRSGRYLAATQHDREIHLIDLSTRATCAILDAPGDDRVIRLASVPTISSSPSPAPAASCSSGT